MSTRAKFLEPPVGGPRQIECVEIYLPKSLAFLSELYRFLRERVTTRWGEFVLDGFSVSEVDGVFQGEQLWEQRTLVIRILLMKRDTPAAVVEAQILNLGMEVASKIAAQEEQIWICH